MNVIIIKPEELNSEDRIVLTDHRARHIIRILKSEEGHSVRIGLLNGALGQGLVEQVTTKTVQLHCQFTDAPTPVPTVDLILALPRPRVMRRLYATLASLGVRRLFLTNANKVEAQYYGTQWLSPEHYEPLLIEGLEQAGDTRLPEVTVIRRLKPFVEDCMDELFPESTRLLAHPAPDNRQHVPPCTAPVVLAIGPEGGWTPFELDLFGKQGFQTVSLGNRPLRTDVACIALISVLHYQFVNADG